MSEGGGIRWMDGYVNYYEGMKNRLDEAYAIEVGTAEGLATLKHWMNDHLDGSDVGGIACFYSCSPWNWKYLPSGTPEAGAWVIPDFSGNPNHSLAFVGYNDSIRYDYNNDGQYTNHLDINGDDTVDMLDWEIGGLKAVDGSDWLFNKPDSGFIWVMYNTLARSWQDGGIWNHVVHVVKPKEFYEPELTAKVHLNFDRREKIRISFGATNNMSDTVPQYSLDFPAFNYQGGLRPMQGPYTNDAKNIELGFDISPLLSVLNNEDSLKVFLLINEYDPEEIGQGFVYSFSVIDHINDSTGYMSPDTNIIIQRNQFTRLAVSVAVDYQGPEITTEELPLAEVNEHYETQLQADYGTSPYEWNLLMDYSSDPGSEEFPWLTENKLDITDTLNGYAVQELDFSFPFYDSSLSQVTLHSSGYILFGETQFPRPYLYDMELYIKNNPMIVPLMNHEMVIDEASGGGIWYSGNDAEAVFRWQLSYINKADSTSFNFAVGLFADGSITYYYDSMLYLTGTEWWTGISRGDEINFGYFGFRDSILPENMSIHCEFGGYPEDISLSDDGILSGFFEDPDMDIPLKFFVQDNDNMFDTKVLHLKTIYTVINEDQADENYFNIYPNPLKHNSPIALNVTESAYARITLYNITGRFVELIHSGYLEKGIRMFSPANGATFTEGIYILKIETNKFSDSKKLLILK